MASSPTPTRRAQRVSARALLSLDGLVRVDRYAASQSRKAPQRRSRARTRHGSGSSMMSSISPTRRWPDIAG